MPVSDLLKKFRAQPYTPTPYTGPVMSEPGAEAPFEQKFLKNLIVALSGAALPGAVAGAGKLIGGLELGGKAGASAAFNPYTALENDPWLSYLTKQDPMGPVNFPALKGWR